MTTRRTSIIPGLLTAVVVMGACKGSGSNATDSSAAAAAAAPAAAPAPTPPAAPATPALTDANIVAILDQANMADSARGRLAETKGTSADVKNFGRLMVGEHHSLRAQGQSLAKKLGVTPEMPAGDQSEAQAKAEMDSLNAMAKGAAWDKAYINFEVGYHQAVLDVANKALGAAQNDQLKKLIQAAAPVIQKHLTRAQDIQKKLGT
jgi:putative membrane protein